ncbi:hypothetical protein Dgeo_3059 (plasmid) [Deinococcus geothermalis DSM 11300]|uniref:Uncharacterized protein n=1 Tax=Deinococcus geothermalis (strain DSM 11300 / CIP 105573 / AG-3a) TaxID=319795 RepID=A8ZRJ1_DEIGD|nr:hypothetical protein [Deinococcus geothermalis]ABW35100.1 hypothetical protein Dgeo_3059 [Deinococcus geothermalis DSM 11300]
MKRMVVALALVGALSGAAGAQTAAPSPGPWWQEQTTVTGVLALAGSALTGWFGHRLGVKQAEDAKAAQRDNADLAAIQTRDKAFQDLMALLSTQLSQRDALVAENAINKTRLEVVESRQKEREEREREQIAKIATLEAKHAELVERQKHLDSCVGGQPCPLAQYRRTP